MKAHALCCYTLQITANKKVFTVEYQEALTDKIISTAINIHTLAWTANNIRVDSHEDYVARHDLQAKAAMQCNVLLSLMDIARKMFHLSGKRIVYWGGMTVETRNLIRAWSDSDRKRYADKFGA